MHKAIHQNSGSFLEWRGEAGKPGPAPARKFYAESSTLMPHSSSSAIGEDRVLLLVSPLDSSAIEQILKQNHSVDPQSARRLETHGSNRLVPASWACPAPNFRFKGGAVLGKDHLVAKELRAHLRGKLSQVHDESTAQ
jgi:hypothetical protein